MEMVLSGFNTYTFAVPMLEKYDPGIVADNCVLDPNVVVMAFPFHRIWLPLTKFVPATLSARLLTPAGDVFGVRAVSVGAGPIDVPVTVSGNVFVTAVAELLTATLTVPGDATTVAGTVACACVAESTVVARAVPFRVIVLELMKPTPVAESVKLPLPAATVDGEIEVKENVEFPPPPPEPLPLIVSISAEDVVVSGFITRIVTVPAVAICAADTAAVSCVVDVTVVGRDTPSHNSVVPLTKFVPVAVSVKPEAPAVTLSGLMAVNVGVTTPLKPPQPASSTLTTRQNSRA